MTTLETNRDSPYVRITKKPKKREYNHVDYQKVYDYLIEYSQKNPKKSPSLREIVQKFDLASPNHARHICLKLEKLGCIFYNKNKRRGIKLVQDFEGKPINTNLQALKEEDKKCKR